MEGAEVSSSVTEEQGQPLPFLEEEEKDQAGRVFHMEECWEEYKLEEELAGGGKMGDKAAFEGAADKSDSSMESLEHCLGGVDSIHALKDADRIGILTLQKNLKELNDIAEEKELLVQKTRDKLSTCQLRSKMLAKQLRCVDVEMEKEEEAGNVAALSRLQAVHRRLRAELQKEKDFELKIASTLEENKLVMWQIETEQGKYENLREQLKKYEDELEMQYQERAEVRIWNEKIAALRAEENHRSREKKEEEAQKEYEEKRKKILEDAKRNHEKAVCFLRKSIARIREENAKEEAKTREHMERRIQAVLSLKTSITSNREKLQALQAWNKAMAIKAKKEEMKMREAILAEGGNVTKENFLHKRLLEHEKEKQASREQQKSRKIEIVSKILQEKASVDKQRKSQSHTKALKGGARSSAGERAASVGAISEEIPHDILCESDGDEEEKDETLVEPEFPGLWSQECDLHKASKEETDPKQLPTTVVRKEVSEKKLKEFKPGIFHKPIASGRECKGCPFYSKPSCILFKDFDVGQIYKKKIVLINASLSVNFCRLIGISEWLKNFISVRFDPPGKMSAGMSCEAVVTFKPMINETLEGEVMFMAQTGSFSVPLRCTAKMCILAVDRELIDFGSHVVGETISQTINLTNSGALGTRFKVQTSAGNSNTRRATAKSSERTVTQRLSDCVPEKKVSNSPVTSVVEKKEQICPDHGAEVPCCAAQVEQQRTGTSVSSSPTEQLGQDVLDSRSDLDRANACNLVELSPEETPVEIMLGKVTEGEIGPFSSVKLQVVFVPAIPGHVRAEFVITFDNSDCKPLCFSAIGVSVDVPVWVPNPNVDLKICMYDRLYQDCVVIRSRAKAALRLKFEICKDLSKHMELLPRTGCIQAQSSFSVQLKFLPRHSLPEDAGNYFNEETGVLEVPVSILVADKATKVNFTVHAIVTTSDLEISPAQIDFGYCTIYEAVQANVTLTNKSILPQEFGFVGLPETVEIQPNDGFGILLPLESLTLDVIFKANKAKEYSFELTCKSEINRQFKLSCKAVGVHPPLELSHSLVRFPATALNSVSAAALYVVNPHVSVNPFAHAVPRTGGGEVAPVGPTSFEFCVPEDWPVTVTPSVGTVLPGKKSLIEVSFRPALSDQLIREEAARRLCRAAATGAETQVSDAENSHMLLKSKKAEKRGGKRPSIAVSRQHSSTGVSKYLTSLESPGETKSEELKPDPHNTLYLELHCPAVAPAVVVTSDNGRNTVDFGDVAVGHRAMKRVAVQNICPEKLELAFSVLNPNGPFLLVTPVGMLEPGENKPLIISFCPKDSSWFFEMLDIRTAKTNLTLSITGRGVVPSTVCSVEEILNMGYVVAREKATSTFKVQNTCTLALPYSVQLDSLSSTWDKDRQRLPSFITSSSQRTEFVGTQNYNGLSVFSIFPTEGEILAGKSQDFIVTFSPDHESLHYCDRLKVVLFGKKTAHVIHLKGAARDHPMFVEGGVPLDVPVESLAVTSPVAPLGALRGELQEPVKSILLILEYIEGESSPVPAVTELKVGGIRTAQFPSKKNVEFSLDDLPLLRQKGFSVEPAKGTVERGQVKAISVSWVPPADFTADDPPLVTALLTLSGDIKEFYRILFTAKVVSA
ncbi:PREDICTED: uncharacterized protein CFAP74 [Apaloderma vittatum]|uniref:uncharacterized protein CFAP74 n=1 Tax=Apaloderma vittatum TaxID=57397 RepID=UPI000521B15E|nr:PREDICTED: uncharacterized protein CFAP74 [Apaloderma vittatum]